MKLRFDRGERFLLTEEAHKTELRIIKSKMVLEGITTKELAHRYSVSVNFLRDIFSGIKSSKDIYMKLEKDFNVKLLDRTDVMIL